MSTKLLNQAVTRNKDRFPQDFMFQLNPKEFESVRSHVAATAARGGQRYRPHAFTEQGVAMLSTVLRSTRAIQTNIAIMRTFVKMREAMLSNKRTWRLHSTDQANRRVAAI